MVSKIFVNTDLKATISCPECKQSHRKDVSRFIGHEREVKLKFTCKCQHTFTVVLERRRFVRKIKDLDGNLIMDDKTVPLKVVDLSKFGMQIKLFSKTIPEVDSILTVEFILDDPNLSRVTTRVKVKRILPPAGLGCEFLNPNHYDNLGKYFLFHF